MNDILDLNEDEDTKEANKWAERGARAAKHFHMDELLGSKNGDINSSNINNSSPDSDLSSSTVSSINLEPQTNQEESYPVLPTNNVTLSKDIDDKLNSLPALDTFQRDYGGIQDKGIYQQIAKKDPSFGATMAHSMEFFRSIAHLGDLPDLNPLSSDTPDGWNPAADENNFVGILPKNQPYIAAATDPNDLFFRRMDILNKQQDDEDFENGSMLAKFLGGTIDTLPFMAIPLGQSYKYATLGKSIVNNVMRAAPGLALGSFLHEATIQANEAGGNIEDTVVNTFVDTVSGLAFQGAGEGLAHGLEGFKIFNARKLLKMNYDGIAPEVVIDNEGKVTGYRATAIDGSVSAAKVDDAQRYLDSSFAQNGLFAVPFLGNVLTKVTSLGNPIIRGLNSPFETVRGFTDRISSHSLITAGILKGQAKPEDFESIMEISRAQNTLYYQTIQKLHDKINGIDSNSGVARLSQRSIKKWTDEGYITPDKFGKDVVNTIISGSSHPEGAVNEAAFITKKYLNDTWDLYRKVFDLPENWAPPPTAEGYFPIVYDHNLIQERPEEWKNMWVNWYKEADNEIMENLKPINDLTNNIDELKKIHKQLKYRKENRLGTVDEKQIKESSENIKRLTRKSKIMKEKLADQIRNDERLFLHADDHSALSGEESKELKNILQPVTILENEIKKERKNIEKLNLKRKSNPEISSKIDEKVLEKEDLIRSYENKLYDEKNKLQERVDNKEINPRFYKEIPGSQNVEFKSPNNLLKFRDVFTSESEMINHANALRDTILNQTPEDTLNQILSHYSGSSSTNSTLKRSQMIPHDVLMKNNMVSTNLPLIVSNYRNALNRKIALKTVFNDVNIDGGIEPIINRLQEEFKTKENSIRESSTISENERAKQLKKLNKQFNEAKEFMSDSFDRMIGRTRGSKRVRELSKFMRLWVVATRLGSVPLTMVTDLSAIMYKHGFWPTIREGLMPALANLAHGIKSNNKSAYIENAAHAHLGLTHVLAAYNDKDWAGLAMTDIPMQLQITNLMEKAAHISGNIALTNYADNFLQRVTANTVQSKIMKYLMDFEKGILKDKDRDKLLLYGLDPKEWSQRFIKGWKERGSDGNGIGGFQSRYWEWSDIEAANKMSSTIFKATRDTVIKRGMMDAPFFTDDPLMGTVVFLKGWASAAVTRYVVPLMQRPDAEHLTGLMVMMAAGSLVSPLRRISRGDEPFDEESNMFWDTLVDSGITSPMMDIIQNANIMANGRILDGFVNDRYRERSALGASMGPIFGLTQDVFKVIGMMLDGQLNENDLKRAGRLIPSMQPWYVKGVQNKMIEGLGLPKNAPSPQFNAAAYR